MLHKEIIFNLFFPSYHHNQSPAQFNICVISFTDEERYIDEGLASKRPNREKFDQFEDKFTAHKQTVVIWCQKDFNQTKKYVIIFFIITVVIVTVTIVITIIVSSLLSHRRFIVEFFI